MTEGNQYQQIIDDPAIREIYANKVISAQFDGGSVVVTLGAQRTTPKRINEQAAGGAMPDVHVSARLALSAPAAIELIKALNGLLSAVQAAATKAISAGSKAAVSPQNGIAG
jgi:hypothetical protein